MRVNILQTMYGKLSHKTWYSSNTRTELLACERVSNILLSLETVFARLIKAAVL